MRSTEIWKPTLENLKQKATTASYYPPKCNLATNHFEKPTTRIPPFIRFLIIVM